MKHHVVFVHIHIANLERLALVAVNFEAQRSIEPLSRCLAIAYRQRNLLQARLRLSASQ